MPPSDPHRDPTDEPDGLRPLPVLESGSTAARSRRRAAFPSWIKARYTENERYRFVGGRLRAHGLHTVCEEAECPNIGECWSHGTATFMLLGDVCTRRCGFCAVASGKPPPLDADEPEKVAAVIEDLGLDYVVLTSVDRDDLPDFGAGAIARTIAAIDRRLPSCRVEALVPDFQGVPECIEEVVRSPLFVFAHNLETVPRLYRRARQGSDYARSLEVLRAAKEASRRLGDAVLRGGAPRGELLTKSSLMLGLGETRGELLDTFADLRRHEVDILTLGQYLQPTPAQLDVFRFVPPDEFDDLRREAEALGFRHVVSGPMSRSSYHAWEVANDATGGGSGAPEPR